MAYRYWLIIKDFYGPGSDSRTPALTWSMGSSKSGSAGHIGAGSGADDVDIREIVISRNLDELSSILSQRTATGEGFGKVFIIAERSMGTDYRTYVSIELTDVAITNIHYSGSGGDDKAQTEFVTFNYSRAEIKYQVVNPSANATAP